MGVYAELRGFVVTHRECGVLRGQGEPEPPGGLRLVVACPCSLGLAAPLTHALAIGLAAQRGILVRGGRCVDAQLRSFLPGSPKNLNRV